MRGPYALPPALRAAAAQLNPLALLALCRAHWSLLLILVAGLALRLPYQYQGHWGDILNISRVATIMATPAHWLDAYHDGYIHAYPYAHPPLGPLLYAPFNWLALATGQHYAPAFHSLIYAFEAAGAVLLYLAARRVASAPSTPALVAGFWFLAPLTILWLPARDAAPDTHFTSVAAAFILAALWRNEHPGQAGALFGLALATRTEAAFLALPWTLHYARTSWRDAAAFAGWAAVTCGSIVLPFFLRDPVALDWALRGHIAERLSQETPLLWRWLEAGGGEAGRRVLEAVLPHNSLLMALGILGVTVLFRRDPWLERYLFLVGLTHVLLMPVFHVRYGMYVLALGLAHVARVGAVHLLAVWALVSLRLDHSALTLGLPWLGTAWESAAAPPLRREGPDPFKARVLALIRSAPWQVPVWAAPVALACLVGGAALVRVSGKPRLETGALLAAALGEPASAPHLALAAWAARLPLGTLAWRVNAVPALAAIAGALLAGVVVSAVFERFRWRVAGHVPAAGTFLLASWAMGLLSPVPPGDSYQSLVIYNLEALERGALVCAGADKVGLWLHAQRVDGLRQDVEVVAGSDQACLEHVRRIFSVRPAYLTSLSEETKRAGLVFFPTRGVWRAVATQASVAEGAVLKGPDERIYVVQGGRRRWIPSLDVFGALGLRWEQVQLASYEQLASIPEGPPAAP